eukprot:m.60513 g.60513  ORF g.60513 m.60513 type:complete len:519 (+) comp11328_c0_seq3:115-1671(+)
MTTQIVVTFFFVCLFLITIYSIRNRGVETNHRVLNNIANFNTPVTNVLLYFGDNHVTPESFMVQKCYSSNASCCTFHVEGSLGGGNVKHVTVGDMTNYTSIMSFPQKTFGYLQKNADRLLKPLQAKNCEYSKHNSISKVYQKEKGHDSKLTFSCANDHFIMHGPLLARLTRVDRALEAGRIINDGIKTAFVIGRWGGTTVYHNFLDTIFPVWVTCMSHGLCLDVAHHPVQLYVVDEGGWKEPGHLAMDPLITNLFGLQYKHVKKETWISVSDTLLMGGCWQMRSFYFIDSGKSVVSRPELYEWLPKFRDRVVQTFVGDRSGKCPTVAHVPIVWLKRTNERFEDLPSKATSGRYRVYIKGITESLRAIKILGFDVYELDLGVHEDQSVFARLARCPVIITGIEGAGFVNQILLKDSGMIQLNFMTHEEIQRWEMGTKRVATGFHSTIAAHLKQVEDTQFITDRPELDVNTFTKLVLDMDERVKPKFTKYTLKMFCQFQNSNNSTLTECHASNLPKELFE